MAQIVAGSVGAIFGELVAETKVGRAVQAGDEAIHHGLGDQIEAGDAGQDGGIEEALLHVELSGVRVFAGLGRMHQERAQSSRFLANRPSRIWLSIFLFVGNKGPIGFASSVSFGLGGPALQSGTAVGIAAKAVFLRFRVTLRDIPGVLLLRRAFFWTNEANSSFIFFSC